jgi:threonine aldolase
MVGGGMRQVGVLAAAGVIALEQMVDRLAEDHANARRLAEGLAAMPGLSIDLDTVQTNIVIFSVDRPNGVQTLMDGCAARKVKIHGTGPSTIRCVTHKDVDGDDIARTLSAFGEITRSW